MHTRLFFIISILAANLFAQPSYYSLLYNDDLDDSGSAIFSQFENRGGKFISGKGWQATSVNSRLFIKTAEPLPSEGTMTIDMTNFDPVTQNNSEKQQIINLYSQENGSKDIFDTNGAWVNIRTGTNYSLGDGVAGFKFLAAPNGIATREEIRCIEDATWNLNQRYQLKITWTLSKIYCFMDNVLLAEFDFVGQVEPFQYIFLGTDNVYQGQPGPIYSNLNIYTKGSTIDPPVPTPTTFTDITSSSGTFGYSSHGYGHGVTFTDVNRDGLPDLFTSNAVRAQLLPDMLFMNHGNRQFDEQAHSRGTRDVGVTHSILNADFDNDGDLDAFFSNMPSDDGQPEGRNALYRNRGNGYFDSITDWGGIINANNGSRGAVAIDIEGDGDLDIYAANWGAQNEMYLNNGHGQFTRVDRGANGPEEDKGVYGQQGVSAADVDNDGDMDFYVCRRQESNLDVPNWLFINDGHGYFTEQAKARNVGYGGRSNGGTFADVDNDGDLDLFVSNYHLSGTSRKPKLGVFFNRGDGYFDDRTDEFNIDAAAYNTIFADVDNDTDLDMLLVNNNSKHTGDTPVLYVNDGAGNFSPVSNAGVEVSAQDARGAATADIDNDGDLDIYIACKYGHNFMLLNNLNSDNHYIQILVSGPGGDFGGAGSKVTIFKAGYLGNPTYRLGYQEVMSNYGYLCQNQPALHFGLAGNLYCDIRVVQVDGTVYDFENVPADQLFAPKFANGPESPIKFTNITGISGTGGYSPNGYAQGVSFSDVNSDGFVDILVSNATRDEMATDLLYINNGNESFSNKADERGISNAGLTDAIVSADFNNDGFIDLFYSNIPDASLGASGKNSLYLNNGSGTFEDKSTWAGVDLEENGSRGALALDIENDGDLDLYVVNWGQPNEMYMNDSTGKMTRVHRGADGPAEGSDFGQQGVTAADVDNDGDIDIYVCRRKEGAQSAANWLFINDGAGNFTEQAAVRGVDYDGRSQGAVFVDVDNDADLDLFVMNYGQAGTSELPYLGVFFNNGNGYFQDRTAQFGIKTSGYTVDFGDVDNDADPDMMLIRNSSKEPGQTPQILLNDGNGNFTEIWNTGFEIPAQDARGTAYGDINNDGLIDIYVACKAGTNYLLRNDTNLENNYLNVQCTGPHGDNGGFGSKVIVYKAGFLGDNEKLLGYQEAVSNFGYMSQNQSALHFGLAKNTQCDVRIIQTDGSVIDYTAVQANQTLFVNKKTPKSQLSLKYIDGNNQHGFTTRPLANPFVVQLMNNFGKPVADSLIEFIITSGDGHFVEPQPVKTGTNGSAAVHYIFGEQTGSHKITAMSLSNDSSRVFFTATAEQLYYDLNKSTGDAQTGVAGTLLDLPVVVRAVYSDSVLASKVGVNFSIESGNGSINGASNTTIQTNENGYAQANWTLGPLAGVQTIKAAWQDSFVVFSAEALTDTPDTLYIVSGERQQAGPGQTLPNPIVVKVTDQYGNPAADQDVLFEVLSGDGNLSGESEKTIKTNTIGQVSVNWTMGDFLGSDNVLKISSRVNGSDIKGSPVLETIAVGAAPDSAASSLTAGTPVLADGVSTSEIVAVVKDKNENVLPGFVVRFNVSGSENNLVVPDSISDENGRVQAFLSSTVIEQKTVTATIVGEHIHITPIVQNAQVEFVTVLNHADSLEIVSGNNQTGTVGEPLANPFVVRVLGDHDQPLADYPVQFVIINGSGRFDGDSVKTVITDENGLASAVLTLGPTAGANTNFAIVRVKGTRDLNVSFTASATASSNYVVTLHGANQIAVVGKSLSDSLSVFVTDDFNNPIDIQLMCAVTAGNGQLDGQSEIHTRSFMNFAFLPGTASGKQTIKVTSEKFGETAYNFDFNVLPDSPAQLVQVSGDSQVVKPGDVLPIPLCTKVIDQYGNAVPEISVLYSNIKDANIVTAQPQLSDSLGETCCRVRAPLLLNTDFSVQAKVTNVDSVVFNSRTAGSPLIFQAVSPDTQFINAGEEQIVEIIILIKDNNGAPKENESISAKIVVGDGEFVNSAIQTSDENGFVNFQVKVGPQSGTVQLLVEFYQESLPLYEKTFYIVISPSTVVVSLNNNKIESYALFQNYPNPFNPTTSIGFQLPEITNVQLAVYNIQGQLVAVLVEGQIAKGQHTVTWDARDQFGQPVPSGIYYYRLHANEFIQTRKLILMK